MSGIFLLRLMINAVSPMKDGWHVAILPREKPLKEMLPKTSLTNLSEKNQGRVVGQTFHFPRIHLSLMLYPENHFFFLRFFRS